MRVVPRGSVLACLPGVGLGVSRCSRALSDRGNAIGWVGEVLSDTVEVNAGSVDIQVVGDMDHNSIAPEGC